MYVIANFIKLFSYVLQENAIGSASVDPPPLILQYQRTVLGPSYILKFPLCYTTIGSVIFLLKRFLISFSVTGRLYSVISFVYFISSREVDQQKCHTVLFLSCVCFSARLSVSVWPKLSKHE